MENASKALIMAAGVLIGVLVLSLGVYLFSSFGSTAAQIQKENEDKLLSKFNSQFTVYQGRKDITIYEILELANLASENNKYYGLDSSNKDNEETMYVSVKLHNEHLETSTGNQTEKINDFISKVGTATDEKKLEKILYNCKKIKISSITRRVCEITFEAN